MNKPREWEIATYCNAAGHFNPIVNGPKTSGEELVKVIEKSAYDQLTKDAEELVEALSEAIESFPKDLQHQTKAYQALATWNAKYGSKK